MRSTTQALNLRDRHASRRRRGVCSKAGAALAALGLALPLLAACSPAAPPPAAAEAPAGRVDAARLADPAAEPEQWFTGGRDRNGTYYSPLAQIDAASVARLGYAWQFRLETNRGLEATPVVVDGTMYAVGNWGRVYALDARTGRELWRYVPPVDGQWGRYACCDVVNRGLAVWQGRVYVASTDGWLQSLDARTGAVAWRVDTLVDRGGRKPYTISGAPLIAGDKVVIGNSGADFSGVRGYVTAYDVASGAQRWRFWTVPRDPALGPQEGEHLEKALATWDPKSAWSEGGGGTVWDGMAYDPELDLVYLGTGNAAPYDRTVRSPKGGDNLYVASIVAVKGGDGTLAWYYQQVPGERWDYTATMKMILADLTIDGRPRKVLMQAPKNGFFYVLDRTNGELVSAKNYTFVNWTKGIDPKTGRPIPNPAAEYVGDAALVYPSQAGGHNWHPMSYSPQTGLVYIPVIDAPMIYVDTKHRPMGTFPGAFTVPGLFPEGYDPAAMRTLFGDLPSLERLMKRAGVKEKPVSRGELRAWDPVQQRVVWSQPGGSFWDGGVMSTGGGLVFRGDEAGGMNVYDARDGRLLKRIDVGSSIMAAPMTYAIAGEQYVAVMAGYGGAGAFQFPPTSAAWKYGNQGRIVAFRLGGGEVPKPALVQDAPFPAPLVQDAGAQTIAQGEMLYTKFCARCHVFGRGSIPDLRRMTESTHENFYRIVLEGAYAPKGMGRWDDVLSRGDAQAIHAYLVSQTAAAYAAQVAAGTKGMGASAQ